MKRSIEEKPHKHPLAGASATRWRGWPHNLLQRREKCGAWRPGELTWGHALAKRTLF